MAPFSPPFFLCIYTFVKVRAIKLYSSHMISWSAAQERSRLPRQNVIPKAGCWGEGEEKKHSGAISSMKYYAGRHSAPAHCRNVCETW